MKLVVNGTPRELCDGLTVRELIVTLGFDGGPVAVERNRDVVPRKMHEQTVLQDGDVVEIVHFVGGG